MKYFWFILAMPAMLQKKCESKHDSVPVCVQQKIDSIKTQPVWNPRAEVNEFLYKGIHVFLFNSNCCDQYYMLYDGTCNYICAPSGGYTGKGDSQCADFSDSAKHVKLVWKDSR